MLQQAIRALEAEIADQSDEVTQASQTTKAPSSGRTVFVVHGKDEAALQAVARFLGQLGLEAIILREQVNAGRTIIEKFEDCAAEVGFAVVLLTPDDLVDEIVDGAASSRARQKEEQHACAPLGFNDNERVLFRNQFSGSEPTFGFPRQNWPGPENGLSVHRRRGHCWCAVTGIATRGHLLGRSARFDSTDHPDNIELDGSGRMDLRRASGAIPGPDFFDRIISRAATGQTPC